MSVNADVLRAISAVSPPVISSVLKSKLFALLHPVD